MTSQQFFTELTRYYRTDIAKEQVRIKYIGRWMVRNKVEYSENTIDRITVVCKYFPQVAELADIFKRDGVKILGKITEV